VAPSDSTIAFSSAAACSSKLKLRQKRLRSASPHARLTRDPKGEWMTRCWSPVSSKKRSKTTGSCVGEHAATDARQLDGEKLRGLGVVCGSDPAGEADRHRDLALAGQLAGAEVA
jgi:hypothetical protein